MMRTGNSISVYCILASGASSADLISTTLSFFLDDIGSPKQFVWNPSRSGPENYTYNQQVFAVSDLESSTAGHNLTVVSYDAVLFDYAVYTCVTSNI